MNYIDKTKSPLEGNQVIDRFLSDSKTGGITYRKHFKKPHRDELKRVLVKEQAGYCCYCMRRLMSSNTTLEHVIPKGIDVAKFSDYVSKYPYFPNTIHRDNFPINRPWQYPPYPHSISYENLVASCNGTLKETASSCCCNNSRGHIEIYPLFYLPNIAELVTYSKLGIISSKDITIKNTLEILKLNNETLKEIRTIWSLARHRQIFINNQSQILDLFEVTEVHQLPKGIGKYCSLVAPYYFDLLLEYNWFYSS